MYTHYIYIYIYIFFFKGDMKKDEKAKKDDKAKKGRLILVPRPYDVGLWTPPPPTHTIPSNFGLAC